MEEVDFDGKGETRGHSEQVEKLAEDEEVELGEVALADAIVDPGAMMVETIDAAQAEVAVSTPRRAD